MEITLGKKCDIDRWMNLVDKVKDNFPGLATKAALEEHRNTVLDFISSGSAICAKSDDKIVGVLLFSKASNMLCFLAVDAEYRRQHIAEKMVSCMLSFLDSDNDVVVTTYREGIPEGIAARAFYKHLGFVEGNLTEEFGSPVQEFILRRELSFLGGAISRRKEVPVMNCILRKWRPSDAKALAAALNNEKILNNLRDDLPFPYTEQDAADYIAAMLSADENDTFAYAITVEDRAIGSIGAFRQANIHRRTAEIGYYLAEEYWGRGIMTEAIRQLCAIVFETTDILRLYAEPFSYNAGSRRALEKAGFTPEGIMKSNAVKNGKVLDMALYSLTRHAEPYPVRRLAPEEVPAALELCWRVFLAFEAPEYPP